MKISTQFRIDEEIYEKIKRIADIERRSINAQMEYFLEKSVVLYESENKMG